jgi:hypothetical protein
MIFPSDHKRFRPILAALALLGASAGSSAAQYAPQSGTVAISNPGRRATYAEAKLDTVERQALYSGILPLLRADALLIRASGDTLRGRAAIDAHVAALSDQGGRVELRLSVRRAEPCADGPYQSGVYAINRVVDARVLNIEQGVFGIRWRAAGPDSVAIAEMRLARDSAHFDESAVRALCNNVALARLRGHRFNVVVSRVRSGYFGRDLTEQMPPGINPRFPQGTPIAGAGDGSYIDGVTVDLRLRFRTFNLEVGGTTMSGERKEYVSSFALNHAFGDRYRSFAPSGREIRVQVTREFSYLLLGVGVTQFSTSLNITGVDSVRYSFPTPGHNEIPFSDAKTTTWYSSTASGTIHLPLAGPVFLDLTGRFRAHTKETLSNGMLVDHGAYAMQVGVGWALF